MKELVLKRKLYKEHLLVAIYEHPKQVSLIKRYIKSLEAKIKNEMGV